jgi:hypothetical protein
MALWHSRIMVCSVTRIRPFCDLPNKLASLKIPQRAKLIFQQMEDFVP